MKLHVRDYEAQLSLKLKEIARSLRNRGAIAVEYSAEEAEQIALKDERDLAVAALDRDTLLYREIQAARGRLADGTFGICEDCEAEIPERRLAAIPWARRCVPCQERADRAQARRSFREFSFAA
jgi:DnaK suppressor protein